MFFLFAFLAALFSVAVPAHSAPWHHHAPVVSPFDTVGGMPGNH